ncbi:SagB-type dehydrogenase family enzyme [Streptosporangium becharense]|uniref:SagB-type dehydrogenase family enzyme n=1 Tax=Streptosporangium becharense TaxID=1816182 RepID=A0A7W9IEG9_9ACTN|nr:SagB/ThcOx family dehydrogenase [Streptosporangium becharense]MBB2909820.1 SagB-type dehydrogenase family enzyme [Streptosporangium becharense]MBB5819225.1 SagB-type dehydrogenase family enzyme [Streptosporangium becharense]
MHPVDAFLLEESEEAVWESYHENSKTSRATPHLYFDRHPSDSTVVAMMNRLRETKPHRDRPRIALPYDLPGSEIDLDEALTGRESARGFGPGPIATADVAKVLRCAYGVTRSNADGTYPRPFRTVPSGGALYPLELYVWARDVTGLGRGLHHYDPTTHELHDLGPFEAGGCFVQKDLVAAAPAVVLVSAIFQRSAYKYGERGYRFVLIEAGHAVQNAVLAACGRGLAAVPVGGYFDRELDALMGLDGLHESVVYTLLLGPREPE